MTAPGHATTDPALIAGPAPIADPALIADPVATADERCDVCDHALAAHDAVSLRYCSATQARALSRACVCRSYA